MSKNKTPLLLLTALLGALCYVSSLFQLSIGPVPFTLQTAMVILSSFLLPPLYAVAAQVVHFFLLFLMGGGLALFLKPSFGFVLGFILASFVMASLTYGKFSLVKAGLAALIGEGIFYLIGIPYMIWILTSFKGMEVSFMSALQMGLIPFIVPDIIKAVLAVLIGSRLVKILGNRLNNA